MSDDTSVMQWLKATMQPTADPVPREELGYCLQDLDESAALSKTFNALFHSRLDEIKEHLENLGRKQLEKLRKENSVNLTFVCKIEPGCEELRALVPKDRLCVALLNWSVNAIRDYPQGQHRCEMNVGLVESENGSNQIRFRLLTDYASPEETDANVRHGRSWTATETLLRPFGVDISQWHAPTPNEQQRGFSAACDVFVPNGFVRKAKT